VRAASYLKNTDGVRRHDRWSFKWHCKL